jgi:hypothetical protein
MAAPQELDGKSPADAAGAPGDDDGKPAARAVGYCHDPL